MARNDFKVETVTAPESVEEPDPEVIEEENTFRGDSPILEISQRNWEVHRPKKARRRKISLAVSQPFISDEEAFDSGLGKDSEEPQFDGDYDEATNEYYDPAKLTFIFSTPSPLVKKSTQIEESEKSVSPDQSPNHSYDRRDGAESGKEPVVTKVEDLLKFTPDALNLWRRRQNVVDQLEERSDKVEHVKDVDAVVDLEEDDNDDASYDPENVDDDDDDDDDVELLKSANVPIIRNRQIHRHDKDDVSKTSNVVKGKADSLELEDKNFPLKRRNDVSHAQYGNSQLLSRSCPSDVLSCRVEL